MRTAAPSPLAPLTRAYQRIRSSGTTSAADVDTSEGALLEALRPVTDSVWPEVAWRSGRLTATGYPVELAWASRDAALRWTSEVAGPETPEVGRLALAAQAAHVEDVPWQAAQRDRPLRYGAWLGVRQLEGVRRSKVYLELPTGDLPPGPWAEAGRDLAHRVLDLTWRMAGLNDDGSVELYARVPELSWAGLAATAELVGDRGALVDLVHELLRRPDGRGPDRLGNGSQVPRPRDHDDRPRSHRPPDHRGTHLPRPSGLSLVLAPTGAPVALTWFTVAKWVWTDDVAVSAAVRRTTGVVASAPASRGLYEALASGPDDGRWRHGMVGVGVDAAGGTWLQAGLRPT